MRILYGVPGEGMGHATRSKVTIKYLLSKGHVVTVVASGRAYKFLAKDFNVIEIGGLEFKYVDGAVNLSQSIIHNASAMPAIIAKNVPACKKIEEFDPQAVISDFDSFAYLYAKSHSLPIASIDNMQMIGRCIHPPAITAGVESDFATAKSFVSGKLPYCDYYVITTFFYPPINPEYCQNTILVPPILRDVVLRASPRVGDHVLVYQTSTSDTRLLDTLNAVPDQRFIVYGLGRDEKRYNCTIKTFREQEFVDDLASCKAVVANGGMSLLGEAVYLQKPVYSVPIRNHFEQILNARYIAGLGYGMVSEWFEPVSFNEFLRLSPRFASRLRSVPRQDGNKILFDTVDKILGVFGGKHTPLLNKKAI